MFLNFIYPPVCGICGKINKKRLCTKCKNRLVIVIGSNAIINKEGKNIVYIIEEEKAVEKEVEIGLDTGELVEIKSGIAEGDMIIIEGQHYVSDGAVVKVVRGE